MVAALAASTVASPAAAATLTPSADFSVNARHPRRNYGTAKRLVVSHRPAQRAFLRFELGGAPRPGTRLVLHIYPQRPASAGLLLRRASGGPWRERRMTFRTAPRTGRRVVRSGPLRRHRWSAIDVTRLVDNSGVAALSLSTTGHRQIEIASREARGLAPRLEVDGRLAPLASGNSQSPAGRPLPGMPGMPGAPAPAPGTGSIASAAQPCGVTSATPAWQHVVWVVMENRSASEIMGSPSAPYINGLAGKCGWASSFYAESHPSLPNYVAMTSGSTQGITDDADPPSHPLNAPSIFSQLDGDWRALEESMPASCAKYNAGQYAVRHNPAAYYTNIAAACAQQDVPLMDPPNLSARFTFVTPNVCSDMHDCSIGQGDGWLGTWMPKLLNTPEYRSGTTAIFLTFDEDDSSASNHVATLVVSPSTPTGTTDATPYNHYSMLRTSEEMLGLPALAGAAAATSMRAGFHL